MVTFDLSTRPCVVSPGMATTHANSASSRTHFPHPSRDRPSIAGEMVPHLKIEEAAHKILGGEPCVVVGIQDEQWGERRHLYQKDLAPVAGKPGATAITRYHPDRSRQPVD
jgi:hypothetical protein